MSRDVKVGDFVYIEPSGLNGIVKFKGPTKFSKGQWIGVKLDTADGKNDGTVNGVKYFTAPEGHGLFVRPEAVVKRKDVVQNMTTTTSAVRRSRKKSSTMDLTLPPVHEDIFPAVKDYENFAFLRIIVEEDMISPVGVDKKGNTALHIVGKKGGGEKGVEVISYLFDHGLLEHIHHQNNDGMTAVMLAAANHNWVVMEFLIGNGADVISKGKENKTKSVWDECWTIDKGMKALHKGMEVQRKKREEGTLKVPKYRHKFSLLAETLFRVARAGDLKYVRMLLEERNMNVNSLNRVTGDTVLHHIANDVKRLPIIKYIVNMGGSIHRKNKVNDTPCLVAARSRAWANMTYLISVGASISVKDEKGTTVFKYAQANQQSKTALNEGLAEKKKLGLTDIGGIDEDYDDYKDSYDDDGYES